MARITFRNSIKLIKEAYKIFKDNHPVKFASAIAYFSLFALPSMFLIIIYTFGLLFSRSDIVKEMQEQLAMVLGEDAAEILIIITERYEKQAAESTLMTLAYTVVVFWLSTQLFRLFQNSLNELWRVKPNFSSFWKKIWVERGITFLMVLATGLIFILSLLIERALAAIFTGGDPEAGILPVVVNILTGLLVFIWFAVLYKVLPMVRMQWGPTLIGAAVTTIFFYLGAWLLWNFVVVRDLEDIYEQVASIIRVALWVFYSSLVFLYGASFTRAYATLQNKDISPSDAAYKYKKVAVE